MVNMSMYRIESNVKDTVVNQTNDMKTNTNLLCPTTNAFQALVPKGSI